MNKKNPFKSYGSLGISPEGVLLDFKADLSSQMGVAYERCLNFTKGAHSHERMVICCARGSTRAEIRDERNPKNIYTNSPQTIVVKPANFYHSVKSLTVIYEDLALLPTVQFVKTVAQTFSFSESQISQFLKSCQEVRRSKWLNELLDQYIVRRILTGSSAAKSLVDFEFFERELIREIICLTVGAPQPTETMPEQSKSISGVDILLQKSIEIMEANLFKNLSLDVMAKTVGMSKSSLLRLFKDSLGLSPIQYLRNRRLDEAKRILATQNYSVSEVACLFGYQDSSSFTRAYRVRFKSPPRKN
jgi:AraC-like DNA-binding protein